MQDRQCPKTVHLNNDPGWKAAGEKPDKVARGAFAKAEYTGEAASLTSVDEGDASLRLGHLGHCQDRGRRGCWLGWGGCLGGAVEPKLFVHKLSQMRLLPWHPVRARNSDADDEASDGDVRTEGHGDRTWDYEAPVPAAGSLPRWHPSEV